MTIASVDVMRSYLKHLCYRDNQVMKFESAGSRANTGEPIVVPLRSRGIQRSV